MLRLFYTFLCPDRLPSKNGYAQKYRQTVESVESVLKKKRKATVGRICRKGFKPGIKKVRGNNNKYKFSSIKK